MRPQSFKNITITFEQLIVINRDWEVSVSGNEVITEC